MIDLERDEILFLLEGIQAVPGDTAAVLTAKLLTELHNNPKFVDPPAEGSVSGISVPPKIDEHGKLPPGCL